MLPPNSRHRSKELVSGSLFVFFACAVVLFVGLGRSLHAAESFEYRADVLPQEAQPTWHQLGGQTDVNVTVEEGVLRVNSDRPELTQWRIGQGSQESGRGFGDSHALPIEVGGAITVDFRVRLTPESQASGELTGLYIWVTNGRVSATLSLIPGFANLGGVRELQPVDSADWSDYRIILEGSRITYLLPGGSQVADLSSTPGKDYGRFIAFGVPQWTEPGDTVPMRGFEIQLVRWFPGQALYEQP